MKAKIFIFQSIKNKRNKQLRIFLKRMNLANILHYRFINIKLFI